MKLTCLPISHFIFNSTTMVDITTVKRTKTFFSDVESLNCAKRSNCDEKFPFFTMYQSQSSSAVGVRVESN